MMLPSFARLSKSMHIETTVYTPNTLNIDTRSPKNG